MVVSGNRAVIQQKVSEVMARYFLARHLSSCIEATNTGFWTKILVQKMMSSREKRGS